MKPDPPTKSRLWRSRYLLDLLAVISVIAGSIAGALGTYVSFDSLSKALQSPIVAGALVGIAGATVTATIAASYARRLRIKALDAQISAAQESLQAGSSSTDVGGIDSRPEDTVGKSQKAPQPDDEATRTERQVDPAWNVALLTLERYWERNLAQNGSIYVMSVIACALGFAVMLWASYAAIHDNKATHATILVAVSGAVTEVLGATFLFIYRSTTVQAASFNQTLERINAAGMAWYVIKSMSDSVESERTLKDTAKQSLANHIVASVYAAPKP